MKTRLMFWTSAAVLLSATLATNSSISQGAIPEEYLARWRDPAIQERIAHNIDKYRKNNAPASIHVEFQGKPLANVEVELRQVSHSFLFGCNAFVLGQLPTAEANQAYEKAFLQVFNFATVPFYWADIEPTEGELRYAEGSREIWRRPPPDRFVAWAKEHHITLKGHPLLWHAHNPPWLPKDAEALKALYRKRFAEIAARYKNDITIWDVVNESLVCPNTFPLFTPDRAYVRWAFAEVAPLFPESTVLMINEVTNFNFPPRCEEYRKQVKSLLADGAAVRGIGFQFHYFRREALDSFLRSPACDPKVMLDVYEQFSQLGLPLYITEITIPSAGEGGEELQAEVVRNLYRLWFSVPKMAGITWWNLGDGTAVEGENEAKGGLLDENLRPKAAYRELDRLINEEWKTVVRVKTDERGNVSFRGGFSGSYQVTVVGGNEPLEGRFDLPEGGPHSLRVVLQNP